MVSAPAQSGTTQPGKAFKPDKVSYPPPRHSHPRVGWKTGENKHERYSADVKSTEEKPRRDCCNSCCFHYARVSLAGLPGYRPTSSAKIKNRLYKLEEHAACVCGGVRLHKGLQNKSAHNRLCLCFWSGYRIPDLALPLILKILLTVQSLAALTTG